MPAMLPTPKFPPKTDARAAKDDSFPSSFDDKDNLKDLKNEWIVTPFKWYAKYIPMINVKGITTAKNFKMISMFLKTSSSF
jgi:hypothetical protein